MRRILVATIAVGLLASCAVAGDPCFHKGTMFSDGANSCQSGSQFRCSDGEWDALNVACPDSPMVAISKNCQMAGITYPTGAASCQGGTQFRCEDGAWRTLGTPCSIGDSPIRIVPSGRTCMFNDATVANASTICRSGTTYLCNNGEWVNLGTMCR